MIIIKDTREQTGFTFAMYDYEVIKQKVNYGDYSLAGFEDVVSIERKATTGELYRNLINKKEYERISKEFEALSKYEYKYIVCEFPESDLYVFPKNSGIPPRYRKGMASKAKFFRSRVYEIQDKYNIPIVFCQDKNEAEQKTVALLEAAYGNLSIRQS